MPNQEIHNYQVIRTVVNDDDRLDVDASNSGTFESEQVKAGTVKEYILKVTKQPIIDLTINSGVVTLDASLSNYFKLTLTEDVTINVTNLPATGERQTIVVECIQDATGGHEIINGTNIFTYDGALAPNDGGGDKFELFAYATDTELTYNVLNR